MEYMINRHRDRLMNSSSQVKALSASRQKSLTNQSIINLVNIQSSQSLKKSRNNIQSTEKQRKIQNQIEELKGRSPISELDSIKKNVLLNSNSSGLVLNSNNSNINNINNNLSNMALPPQPNMGTGLKQKNSNKQQPSSFSQQTGLKSSRYQQTYESKVVQKVHQTIAEHKDKGLNKQKSKSKTSNKKNSSRTPKKQVILTVKDINQSFSQAIFQVFINDIREKNLGSSIIPLLNKDSLKHRVSLLLDQHFTKRVQLDDRNRVSSGIQISRTNRQVAQSYAVEHGYTAQSVIQSNSHAILPNSMSVLPVSSQFYQTQLQKRLLQSQKQRQYLSTKVQSLTKKLQSISRQLQKSSKLQKIISSITESQNETRRQVNRLRRQLQVSELKNSQQQKVWRKQIGQMRQIIHELRGQLQASHHRKNQKNEYYMDS